MIERLSAFLERIDLTWPQGLLGQHFHEVLALLSIVFGGSFLFFGWRHHRYYTGVLGLLAGGWIGLLLKQQLCPAGTLPAFLYLTLCGGGGCLLAVSLQRFLGILLGGFLAAVVTGILFPEHFAPANLSPLTLPVVFAVGGGLGALFPRLFFILASSLIGASFVTFGVSAAVLPRVLASAGAVSVGAYATLLHAAVFLPCFLFGVAYQFRGPDEAPAAPRGARPIAAEG